MRSGCDRGGVDVADDGQTGGLGPPLQTEPAGHPGAEFLRQVFPVGGDSLRRDGWMTRQRSGLRFRGVLTGLVAVAPSRGMTGQCCRICLCIDQADYVGQEVFRLPCHASSGVRQRYSVLSSPTSCLTNASQLSLDGWSRFRCRPGGRFVASIRPLSSTRTGLRRTTSWLFVLVAADGCHVRPAGVVESPLRVMTLT